MLFLREENRKRNLRSPRSGYSTLQRGTPMKNWIYFLAAALLLSTVGLAAECMRLESEADAAEAHAQAADERAGSCEAKFSYSTVILLPSAPAAAPAATSPGMNFYHGLFRLSVNLPAAAGSGLMNQPGNINTAPAQILLVPAKITPQGAQPGASYYWVKNSTREQSGPYPVPTAVQ
jgi:hypothetical protein